MILYVKSDVDGKYRIAFDAIPSVILLALPMLANGSYCIRYGDRELYFDKLAPLTFYVDKAYGYRALRNYIQEYFGV